LMKTTFHRTKKNPYKTTDILRNRSHKRAALSRRNERRTQSVFMLTRYLRRIRARTKHGPPWIGLRSAVRSNRSQTDSVSNCSRRLTYLLNRKLIARRCTRLRYTGRAAQLVQWCRVISTGPCSLKRRRIPTQPLDSKGTIRTVW